MIAFTSVVQSFSGSLWSWSSSIHSSPTFWLNDQTRILKCIAYLIQSCCLRLEFCLPLLMGNYAYKHLHRLIEERWPNFHHKICSHSGFADWTLCQSWTKTAVLVFEVIKVVTVCYQVSNRWLRDNMKKLRVRLKRVVEKSKKLWLVVVQTSLKEWTLRSRDKSCRKLLLACLPDFRLMMMMNICSGRRKVFRSNPKI